MFGLWEEHDANTGTTCKLTEHTQKGPKSWTEHMTFLLQQCTTLHHPGAHNKTITTPIISYSKSYLLNWIRGLKNTARPDFIFWLVSFTCRPHSTGTGRDAPSDASSARQFRNGRWIRPNPWQSGFAHSPWRSERPLVDISVMAWHKRQRKGKKMRFSRLTKARKYISKSFLSLKR